MICITLDIDWLSDDVIDFVASILKSHKVPATWFVTHQSPAVDRLRQFPEIFELGIHPNFMTGSTHGKTPREVLEHCMSIVPDAVSMRTHGLLQSTSLLAEVLTETPIKFDCSLYLPGGAHLTPIYYHWRDKTLVRIPFCWEDDFVLESQNPVWLLDSLLHSGSGLKVFNFHPLFICLNASQREIYYSFRKNVKDLRNVTMTQLKPFIQEGRGIRHLFTDLIKHVAEQKEAIRLKDLRKMLDLGAMEKVLS